MSDKSLLNADVFVQPTNFTGNYPSWNGYTWLDWAAPQNTYHPGDDYNLGFGDEDCGQDVKACANGLVIHASKSKKGYGNLIIIKHQLGYNLKRFIKETYNIETDQLLSLYAHLKDILVSIGSEVDCDALIAHVGKTGTKLCHTHFEIFSLWKDLKNTTYRFYPVGWPKEKIMENWLPAYLFIEATKNIETYSEFLGKSKDYWLQVEEDREGLLTQLGEKEKEFLKIQSDLVEQREKAEKENRQLKKDNARCDTRVEKAVDSGQNKVKKLEKKLNRKTGEISELKTKMTDILAEQSKKYQPREAFSIFLGSAFEKLKETLKKGNGKTKE